MSKNILGLLAIAVVAVIGWYVFSQWSAAPIGTDKMEEESMGQVVNVDEQDSLANELMESDAMKDPVTGSVRSSDRTSQGTLVGGVREFSMDSYFDRETGRAVFTLGEMVAKKGETVRVKVRNTFGKHDFKIDELNVFSETPQDETTVIEFTPDQAGEYIYYCSKVMSAPGHRALGQWGLLRVTE